MVFLKVLLYLIDLLILIYYLLIYFSELHGTCCIETTHLDNEIDLKIKQSPRELLYCNEFKDYINFDGIIECELPNKLLYSFLGRLTIANNNR